MAASSSAAADSAVAALLALLASAIKAGHGAGGTLSSALSFGSLYVIVGLGQMAVVTRGRGNIDLSVPSTIALSGCTAMKLMDGANIGIVPGIYTLSGLMAAVCRILLASFSGGAALDMGREYLLSSIAVVVIGGAAVAGGRASVTGVWSASLFLFLLVIMLDSFAIGAGGRTVLTGLIIIAVVAAASGGNRSSP